MTKAEKTKAEWKAKRLARAEELLRKGMPTRKVTEVLLKEFGNALAGYQYGPILRKLREENAVAEDVAGAKPRRARRAAKDQTIPDMLLQVSKAVRGLTGDVRRLFGLYGHINHELKRVNDAAGAPNYTSNLRAMSAVKAVESAPVEPVAQGVAQ